MSTKTIPRRRTKADQLLTEDFMEAIDSILENARTDFEREQVPPDKFLEALRTFAIEFRRRRNRSFNTIREYLSRLKRFLEFVYFEYEIDDPELLEEKHAQEFIEEEEALYAQSTVIVSASAVTNFFEFVLKKKISLEVRYESRGEQLPEYLTYEEVRAILDYIMDKGRFDIVLFFMVLWDTGCRVGEALNLTWDDVNLKDNTITIRRKEDIKRRVSSGKSGEFVKRISPETADMFRKYMEVCKSDKVIFPFRYETARYHVKTAMKDLGINKKGALHLFRHGRFTFLAKQNFDPIRLKKFTGHKKWDILMRYLHLATSDIEEEFEKKVKSDVMDELLPNSWKEVNGVEVGVKGDRMYFRLNGRVTFASKETLKIVKKKLSAYKRPTVTTISNILRRYCREYDKTEVEGILPECLLRVLS